MRSSLSLARSLARAAAPHALRRPLPEHIPASKRLFHSPRTSTPLRPHIAPLRSRIPSHAIRYESSSADAPAPVQGASSATAPETRLERDQVPAYELTFTCKQCTTRSSHRVSKQGYHHGTVLINCPGCKNRHLISDHLKIFSDKPLTIEDLMREKGQLVKRGNLSSDGDVEFWDDGSSTPRSSQSHFIPGSTTKSDPDAEEGRLTESPSSQSDPEGVKGTPPEKS